MNNQALAFEKFSRLKVGALFMKMGSGKTKVAIDLINYNIKKIDVALFVAPNATLNNLNKEINKWKIECPFIVQSYENISMSDKGYAALLEKLNGKKIFIVADESIFIKNEESIRFNRLVNIRKKCDYALILNGTPITKNEWDMYNQMYFLSPLIIGMGRQEFLNSFFTHVIYKRKGELEKSFYKFSKVNSEYLTKLISPYIFKSDLEIEIKEKEQTILVLPSTETLVLYEHYKKKLLENLEKRETILGNLNLLSKAAADDNNKAKMIATYARSKKLIIYCQFKSEVNNIVDELKEECFVLTGETKKQTRHSIIESFKRSSKPLIMTFGVGSFGLNLQFCNEIIYSSISFDYAKIEQSKYRIKRIGQEKEILYTNFKTGIGIEKLIQECIDRKETLSEIIKGDIENWEKFI